MSAAWTAAQESFPSELEVVIDVPRFGFVKRDDHGHIDFVSPLPCPFNYGSVPGSRSGDGDREDAVVLGQALPRGTRLRVPVVARVSFIDAGVADPKWICSAQPLTAAERASVVGFFVLYARLKRVLNVLRGKSALTRYAGIVVR
jgi:inorganic pyrophosphatase